MWGKSARQSVQCAAERGLHTHGRGGVPDDRPRIVGTRDVPKYRPEAFQSAVRQAYVLAELQCVSVCSLCEDCTALTLYLWAM